MGLGMLVVSAYSVLMLGVAGLCVIEQLLRFRRRRYAPAVQQQRTMSSAALDVMSVLFSPSDRHRLEYLEAQEFRRDQPEQGSPPRSQVDLDGGMAWLVIPTRARDRQTA